MLNNSIFLDYLSAGSKIICSTCCCAAQFLLPGYSALSNKIKKCDGIGFESDGATIIIGHKNVTSKLKRNTTKMISIHNHNYRLALAILSSFKESIFLMTNN